MKTIEVFMKASWGTEFEVPDDFEVTPESILALIQEEEANFDYMDGSAEWEADSYRVQTEGEFPYTY